MGRIPLLPVAVFAMILIGALIVPPLPEASATAKAAVMGDINNPRLAEQKIVAVGITQEILEDIAFPEKMYVEVSGDSVVGMAVTPHIRSLMDSLNVRMVTTPVPVRFKRDGAWYISYTFIADIPSRTAAMQLLSDPDVLGVWEIPEAQPIQLPHPRENMDYVMDVMNMEPLVRTGRTGQKTVVALIDWFGPSSKQEFLSRFPDEWHDRIVYFDWVPTSNYHGLMTSTIVGYMAQDADLMLIAIRDDDIWCFDQIIRYADAHPDVQVISSNSWCYLPWYDAYTNPDHVCNRKVLEMVDSGIIVAFSAGNFAHEGEHDPEYMEDWGWDGRRGLFTRDTEIGYPGTFPEVISVAGTCSRGDMIVSYSSLGPGVGGVYEPDISAPTEFLDPWSPYDGRGGGTSASCPAFASAVAVALSNAPDAVRPGEVPAFVDAIHRTAQDRGVAGFDYDFGYGLVDADALHKDVVAPTVTPPIPLPLFGFAVLGGIFTYGFEEER